MAVPYTFGSATTSIPLSQLDSNFATAITLGNTAVQLGNTIANLTGVSNVASATSLSLGSNGNTTAVTIDTSQNVGIGTVSPSYKLDVASNDTTAGFGYAMRIRANATALAGAIQFTDNPVTTQTGAFAVDNSSNMKFITGATERMRIDSSGNVGIGTTSPNTSLNVTGPQFDISYRANISSYDNASIAANIGGGIMFGGNYTGTTRTSWAAINGLKNNATDGDYGGYLSFKTRANGSLIAEAMRIDSSGNLLVGNTATDKGVLTVYNNSASFASVQAFAYFKGTQSGDVGMPGLYVMKYDNNSTTSQILVKFGMNNGVNGQGQINANGAGAAAFGSFSDARLKENIVDLPPQLANIMALRPVEFDYIESEGGGHQTGFIAQEVQAVYEDCVGERADGMLTVTGWSKTEARLVKAIQEQQALITAQAETINALTARVVALESK